MTGIIFTDVKLRLLFGNMDGYLRKVDCSLFALS